MKKVVALGLVMLLCAVMFAGAEDAKVMPKMVGRLYLAPAFAFANGAFNNDGEYTEYPSGGGSLKTMNLVIALEYGIVDWITGALQWKPGVNLWSDVDMDLPIQNAGGTLSTSDVNTHGVSDLFLGAKVQIIGEKAPVQNTMFRLSLAPGVKIPLPGPDYEEQYKNAVKNDPVSGANLDKHVLGLGARVYFDYIIHKNFFINLYGEFIGYPVKGEMSKSGLSQYGAVLGAKTFNTTAGTDMFKFEDEVSYGYELTFELEPVFTTPIAKGITLTAGLPFNYHYFPGNDYSDFSLTAAGQAAIGSNALLAGTYAKLAPLFKDEDPKHLLTITPNVAFFFTGWFLPTEFKLQYAIPAAGKNDRAMHSVGLIVKLYFKIPSKQDKTE